MSRPELSMLQQVVTRDNLVGDLMLVTDADFNGTNGPDYLSEIAKGKGFDSNLALYCSEAMLSHDGNMTGIIEEVLRAGYIADSYYEDYEQFLYPLDEDTVLVTIAYLS